VALAHDTTTRFPALGSETTTDTTSGNRSFSHAGSASAKGVSVAVMVGANTNGLAGVTYGGVALVLTRTCIDTTEAGRSTIWSLPLDAVCPTGTQTVDLLTCTTDAKVISCNTFTAATTGTKVNASNNVDTTTSTNPSVTVVTTATALLYGAMSGGGASFAAVYTAGSGYTQTTGADFGAKAAGSQHSTSPVASGSIVFNMTAASDDWSIAAVAYEEYTLAAVVPPIYPTPAPRSPSPAQAP